MLKNVVYLKEEDYINLKKNGTVEVNGQTVTYSENDIYMTPDDTDSKLTEMEVKIYENGLNSGTKWHKHHISFKLTKDSTWEGEPVTHTLNCYIDIISTSKTPLTQWANLPNATIVDMFVPLLWDWSGTDNEYTPVGEQEPYILGSGTYVVGAGMFEGYPLITGKWWHGLPMDVYEVKIDIFNQNSTINGIGVTASYDDCFVSDTVTSL